MNCVSVRRALLLMCLLCVGLSGPMAAQEALKILAVRGQVTSSAGTKLMIGQTVGPTERITVASGGYVSFVHPNGRSLELKTPTTVAVRDLNQRLTRPTSSTSKKFASYVASELTETSEPIAFKSKRRGNMKTTGSVERASGDDVNAVDTVLRAVGAPGEIQALADLSAAKIEREGRVAIIMPRSTRLLSDTVLFTWRRTPRWTSYRLVVTDRRNAVVVTRETEDTSLTLPLRSLGIVAGELYTWRIEAAAQPSERTPEYALWLLDEAGRSEALAVLRELDSEQDDPSSAIALMIRAAALEDLGLIYDAYQTYQRVLVLEPGVRSYRRTVAEFLVRQSLTIEAYTVYESQ